jgi:hypothetical protein
LLARRAVVTAPQILDAQKLLMLCLAGTEQREDAERRRRDLLRSLPAEPDLARWRFAPESLPAGEAASVGEAEAIPVDPADGGVSPSDAPRRRRNRFRSLVWGVRASAALSAAAAVVALMAAARLERFAAVSAPSTGAPSTAAGNAQVQRPYSAAPPTPRTPPVMLPGTSQNRNPSLVKNQLLASDLAQEMALRRREADFQQARVWFNRAVHARSAGAWADCDRLAAAAYALGGDSYLGDEALLLRAQAAEALGGDGPAAIRYAELAEKKPGSVYAAWALARAVRLARRSGRRADAERYERLLSERLQDGSGASTDTRVAGGGGIRADPR